MLSSICGGGVGVVWGWCGGGVGVMGYALYTTVPVYTQSVDIRKCASIYTVS